MNAIDLTPDLFDGQREAPPRGIHGGPSFSHQLREAEQEWRQGWHLHTGAGWAFMPYVAEAFTWLRQQLAEGPQDYGDLLDARRATRLEGPFEVAEIIRAHIRYLVLAGEAKERKRFFGDSDPRSPHYHGWHPVIELVEANP